MKAASNIVRAQFSANQVEPDQSCPTPKTTSSAQHKRHWFKYAGRRWRIFKRSTATDAAWYIEFQRDHQRTLRSLETSSLTHAEAEAKSFIDAWLRHRRDERSGLKPRATVKFSRLAEIIGSANGDLPGLVLTIPTKKMASATTRRSYAWSLRWVLRMALGITDAQVDELTTEVLSKDTARRFFDAVNVRAAALLEQAEQNTFLRNAYSFYDNARALFAPRPLEAMRSTHGLVLPDLADWRNGKALFGQAVPEAHACELPSDALVFQTIREWIRMGREPGYQIPGGDRTRRPGVEGHCLPLSPMSELDRRNTFIALGMELSCGFRVSETQRARRDWVTTEAGGLPVVRCLATQAKNKTGKIEVSPVDPFWRILWFWVRRNGWDVPADQYLLSERPRVRYPGRSEAIQTGGVSDRNFWPEMLCSRFLRGLGWRTQKSNHALRDWSASMITMRYGIGLACDWCRHSTIATTEGHYQRFVKLSKRLDPKRLAWFRWARSNAPDQR